MTAVSPQLVPGGNLLSVPGLRGGAVAAGLKPSGAPDLALLVADRTMSAAGVFTRNRLPAAPVVFDRERLASSPSCRAIVINAGIANAMTGAQGHRDAAEMAERAERHAEGSALVLSTGVIGSLLPMELVRAGIDQAAAVLQSGEAAGRELAEAIRTTDTCRKTHAVKVRLPAQGTEAAREVVVGGMAKGSGMIHPDMATMLAVVATDCPVAAPALRAILTCCNDQSFHQISVDGDTSTNDTVLLLAGGPGPELDAGDPRLAALEGAVLAVMEALARAVVADGEGMSRLLEIEIQGARTQADARAVAESIARSSLVKTALAGGDPNWGRLFMAAANAGVALQEDQLALDLGGVAVVRDGRPLPVDAVRLQQIFAAKEVHARLHLGQGQASARRWTTDLTHDYIRINAEYTT